MTDPGTLLDCRLEGLLDPSSTPVQLRTYANDWFEDWAILVGHSDSVVSPPDSELHLRTALPSGRAISPLDAARCLQDFARTVAFVRATDAAIRRALARNSGRPVHLLEAGCGPFAPMSLPFARRYGPELVQFTLLDIHRVSLEHARRFAELLGVSESIRDYCQADATKVTFPTDGAPDIIVCEVLQRALTREPQVEATLHLMTQLGRGGEFLPRRIEVRAALFDGGSKLRQALIEGSDEERTAYLQELGGILTLDVDDLPAGCEGFPVRRLKVPAHDPQIWKLRMMTRIAVDDRHSIDDFDSGLTLPEAISYPSELLRDGGLVEFRFHTGASPGPRMTSL